MGEKRNERRPQMTQGRGRGRRKTRGGRVANRLGHMLAWIMAR